MQLNQNLLEVSRKVCVTPTQSSSSRSKARKESSTARGEPHQSFPRSRIQLSQVLHLPAWAKSLTDSFLTLLWDGEACLDFAAALWPLRAKISRWDAATLTTPRLQSQIPVPLFSYTRAKLDSYRNVRISAVLHPIKVSKQGHTPTQ